MARTLDELVTRMYKAITFERGSRPDWEDDRRLFRPGAKLVRITDKVEEYDLPAFEIAIDGMIERGELPEFYEAELARQTLVFGDIAHIWSVYESRRQASDPNRMGRGINSIQAIRRDGEWLIHSMIWFRESAATPIPEEYLRKLTT